MRQGVFQLVSTPADKAVGREQLHLILHAHRITRLFCRMTIYPHLPSHDRALGFGPAFAQTTINEGLIHTRFQSGTSDRKYDQDQ